MIFTPFIWFICFNEKINSVICSFRCEGILSWIWTVQIMPRISNLRQRLPKWSRDPVELTLSLPIPNLVAGEGIMYRPSVRRNRSRRLSCTIRTSWVHRGVLYGRCQRFRQLLHIVGARVTCQTVDEAKSFAINSVITHIPDVGRKKIGFKRARPQLLYGEKLRLLYHKFTKNVALENIE